MNSLEQFLNGKAGDQQQLECERWLSDPDSVVHCESTIQDDSLVAVLRAGDISSLDQHEVDQLVEKIEQLVPRHVITAEELAKILHPADRPGDLGKIQRFRVVEFMASGGMGLVFRCIDPSLDREVCVKLLNPQYEFNVEAKTRFERESREAARLNCERIVTILEVGNHDGLPFLVMPLLAGMSLRTLLKQEEYLEFDRAMAIVGQVAEGLQYAHQRGILHRDIKPDNLWLTPAGTVKILDFGLVQTAADSSPITRSGTVIGTPSYMSPEQVTGGTLAPNSDLFSLGIVLVELLTGESPFKRTNLFSTLMSVAGDEFDIGAVDPENRIPKGLRQLVQQLLCKDATQRIGSAAELIERLDRVEASPHLAVRTKSAVPSGRWLAIWVAALALSIVLGGFGFWQMLDKGTLVVSTDDPDVEVKIEDHKVSVFDPLTDRRFEVRIGDTALPSGVYLLETTDATGELIFSSQTIAIKRGRKTIVTVQLLNPKSQAGLKTAMPEANETPAAETSTSTASVYADSTYLATPELRKKAVAAVRKLPALSLPEMGLDSSGAISANATVQSPRKVAGVDGWSIEPVLPGWNKLQPNADSTRWADFHNGFVRVFKQNGDLAVMFPVPGKAVPLQIRWDNKHPDLIAVSSYVEIPFPHERGEENPMAISVWRLSPQGAHLLRQIRASKSGFAWDGGYRIISTLGDQLLVTRISDAVAWSVPGAAAGELRANACSPDGRYVVTREVIAKQSQISVWDLKRGELSLSIAGARSFHWHRDSDKLAVTLEKQQVGSRKGQIEVWSLPTKSLARSLYTGDRQETAWETLLNSDFSSMATWHSWGELVLTDTRTRRRTTIMPPQGSQAEEIWGQLGPHAKVNLRWVNERELRIQSGNRVLQWTQDDHASNGKFTVLDPDKILVKRINQPRFRLIHAMQATNGDWVVVGTSDQTKNAPGRARPRTYIASRFTASGKLLKQTRYLSYDWLRNKWSMKESLPKLPIVSPCGNFVLAFGESTRRLAEPKQLQLRALDGSKEPLAIGDFGWVSSIAWSKDSKYLLVYGWHSNDRGTRNATKAVDLQAWKGIENIPTSGRIVRFHTWRDGFLVDLALPTKGKDKTYRFQTGYLTLAPVPKLDLIGDERIWSGADWIEWVDESEARIRWQSQPQASSQNLRYQRFRIAEDLSLQEIEPASIDYIKYSRDGKFGYRKLDSTPSSVAQLDNTVAKKYLIEQIEAGGTGEESPVVSRLGFPENFQWHRLTSACVWRDGSGVFFADAEQKRMRTLPLNFQLTDLSPTKEGWMAVRFGSIMQYDLLGRAMEQTAVDIDADGIPVSLRNISGIGGVVGPAAENVDGAAIYLVDGIFKVCDADEFAARYLQTK